jgi:hypothetical protein
MLFSPQKWFCTVCGKEQFSQLTGNKFVGAVTCSPACYREFKWRETLAILGKEYYPDPEPHKKD